MSQKFDNNVLDIVKEKVSYPYKYMNHFEKSKEELPSKKKFIVPWSTEKWLTKNMNMPFIFGINLKWNIITACI